LKHTALLLRHHPRRGLRGRARQGARGTDALLDSLYYVPSEPEVARTAGLLRRDWRRKGVGLTRADAFLAALALRYGLVFLTDNVKHLPMRDLVVWTPDQVPH
jgi:predicted nucleic acid-binding protein